MNKFILNIALLYAFMSLVSFNTYATPYSMKAEGCGAMAAGGNKDNVYHVSNLNDKGDGSLRDAVSKNNRVVVFDVSGTIKLKSALKFSSNLTIEGETAPKPGITVYGNTTYLSNTNNNIVRYMRFRQGSLGDKRKCCVYIDNAKNILFDHDSIEWGRWDNLHIVKSNNVTIQYSIIGQSINPQNFGCIMGESANVSIHHCLWVNNKSRNPKGKSNLQYINNVIYNWAANGYVGGHSGKDYYEDLINNYFIKGPVSNNSYIGICTINDHIYASGNYADLNRDGKLNGTLVTDNDIKALNATVELKPYIKPLVPVTIDSAEEAYIKVIKYAGDSIYRDDIDTKLINDVMSLGRSGEILKNAELK